MRAITAWPYRFVPLPKRYRNELLCLTSYHSWYEQSSGKSPAFGSTTRRDVTRCPLRSRSDEVPSPISARERVVPPILFRTHLGSLFGQLDVNSEDLKRLRMKSTWSTMYYYTVNRVLITGNLTSKASDFRLGLLYEVL